MCFSCGQWTAQGSNYNVIAKENLQLIFDLRWQANGHDRISTEQTNLFLFAAAQGSINTGSMNEIVYLLCPRFWWSYLIFTDTDSYNQVKNLT